ncbi:hypothetical protein PIB30_038141 [Stylosanthes scabra]|uniref:Uncharacterized protein n=1 Tax=Stylosanthes scabra TaxID=79078 RepID=A0ABU6VCJ0_9FABA|nr:hypothetical protein [Stylosanthes scabra]
MNLNPYLDAKLNAYTRFSFTPSSIQAQPLDILDLRCLFQPPIHQHPPSKPQVWVGIVSLGISQLMGFDYYAQKHERSSPNSQNSKTCKVVKPIFEQIRRREKRGMRRLTHYLHVGWIRRGRRELRVAANRASIGVPDQKLSRPECGGGQ